VDAKPPAGSSTVLLGSFRLTLDDSLWQGLAADEITSAPVVAKDGTVYVPGVDGILYVFNADGTKKWTAPAITGGFDTTSAAVADDGTVYLGGSDGNVRAFNPDGTAKWTTPFATTSASSVSNAPSIAADGTVYLKADSGILYALNPDGTQKWTFDTKGNSYASVSIAADGTIYIPSGDNNLYALNPDGTQKWRFPADNQLFTAPAIDSSGNIYFGSTGTASGGVTQGSFYSVTPAGVQRWVYKTAGAITSSPAISGDGQTVYFGCYDTKLHAVDTGSGAARWTFKLGDQVRASSPAVDSNGVVYIGCYDDQLYAVNADGTLKRTYPTGFWVRSSPVIAGTRLYVGSNDHRVYAFDIAATSAAGPWPQFHANSRHLGRAVSEAFALTAQPQSQIAVLGLSLTLNVTASGTGPLTYQWKKDGVDIAGATAAALTISNVTATTAGAYTVAVSGPRGTLTSSAANITVQPITPGRLTNLSVRTTAGTGTQTLIVGFVVTGTNPKPLLVRGIGPALTGFGVTDALAAPQLQVISGTTSTMVASNTTGWGGSAALASAFASVGAFPLDATSKDAALVATLAPGSYTAQIVGANNTTGTALAEVYDTEPTLPPGGTAPSRLFNVSARAQVGTGGNILIAGFTISGNVPKQVLIRGIGPALTSFSVSGFLANPRLDIYSGSNLVSGGSNDDWGGTTALSDAFKQVGAFALTNISSRDAALLITLPPGGYTAQVTGVGNTIGVALIEVYEMP
jgi:outer membrane protein assembly factor BamB